MTVLLPSLINAVIVLALALIAARLMRPQSAALRHAILTTAVICAALMPALELVLPDVPVISWRSSTTVASSGTQWTSGEVAETASAQVVENAPRTAVAWTTVLVGVWLAASAVTCLLLLTDLLRLASLRRRCTPVTGARRVLLDALSAQMGVSRPVALLETRHPSLLVTYGFRAPGIIIPATSADWSDERLRIVFQHELAHIARHDAAIQCAGEVLRVLQPINPLVWLALRRLRQESEYACDDAVLGAGVVATTYADHLLDVARQLSHRHAAWAAAPAIAHPSTLERRIVAMLQKHTNRRPLTHRGWSAAVLIAAGISLPLAAASLVEPEVVVQPPQVVAAPAPVATPAAEPVRPAATTPVPVPASARTPVSTPAPRQPGTITGQVTDQSGGVIPGANVTLTDRQTGTRTEAISNAMGRFTFPGVTGAEYDLVVRLSGFKTVTSRLTVSSGATMMQTVVLPVGSLSETITVICAPESFSLVRALFPVLSAQTPSRPVRVGGQIREPKKIRDVRPTCPAGAPQGEHVVRLTGTIGADGAMTDLAESEGADAPADLVAAGLTAARQWMFTPTQLNGQPVEVTIDITIKFTKS